jgi:hypothetical protein
MVRLKARCGRCGVAMKRHMESGCDVFTCHRCSRVAIFAGTVEAADTLEARMVEKGYQRCNR